MVARFGTTEETAFASRYSSALLNFSPNPCRERIYPFRFFSGALAHLRIRLLPLPGVETMEETMAATRYSSALLDFLPRPCREQTCLFRFFRGALALYLYIILRQPGVETTEETMAASRCVSAMLSFSPYPCREQACPFRLPRFCLHPPVGIPQ